MRKYVFVWVVMVVLFVCVWGVLKFMLFDDVVSVLFLEIVSIDELVSICNFIVIVIDVWLVD